MSALLLADHQDVRRAAVVLAQVDDEALDLAGRLRRQPLACWASPSGRDYRAQVEQVVQDLLALGRAHTEAAVAVHAYALALAEAQDLARRGTLLQQSGAERSARWQTRPAAPGVGPQAGPDLGALQVLAGQRAVAEAEQQEREAAARAAAVLRGLAAGAPRLGRLDRGVRVLDDLVRTTVDGIVGLPAGLAALGRAAWDARPGHDGEEQAAGREAVLDAVQVWEQVPHWFESLTGGRPGEALGAVIGGARNLLPGAKPSGHLKGILTGELTVDDIDAAWEQAHAARALQDRISRLSGLSAPTLDELRAGPIDLARHERGAQHGHTIERHVGSRLETLQARLDLVDAPEGARRSTFPDLGSAEAAVTRAVHARIASLEAFLSGPGTSIQLASVPLPEPVGTVLHGDGRTSAGTFVDVDISRVGDRLQIVSAYLSDRPRDETVFLPKRHRQGSSS